MKYFQQLKKFEFVLSISWYEILVNHLRCGNSTVTIRRKFLFLGDACLSRVKYHDVCNLLSVVQPKKKKYEYIERDKAEH